MNNIVEPKSGVTMLNNNVDNIEQCGKQTLFNPVFINPEQVDRFLPCRLLTLG